MSDIEINFGANIIENITTGMYEDSRVVFREFIQNSCDSIDRAVAEGIMKKSEARVEIKISPDERKIEVSDNARGIPSADFQRILADVANSEKTAVNDKGFRGIGRLAALAYCQELVFSSSFKGEETISIMRCDAKTMRRLLDEHATGKERYTALEILQSIYNFSTKKDARQTNSHFFKVEMIGVNSESSKLLDVDDIQNYLSFIAPVPYSPKFNMYKSIIYRHGEDVGCPISDYTIRLNGEQLLKPYGTRFSVHSAGEDQIYNIEFTDFRTETGELVAWAWLGLSTFKGSIISKSAMRGIRVRKENIQIGFESILDGYMPENKGSFYFVGEIHVASKELIPNSQRNFFNENAMRLQFEEILRSYGKDLNSIRYKGSKINTLVKKIEEYESLTFDYEKKLSEKGFATPNVKEAMEKKITDKKKDFESAKNELNNIIVNEGSSLVERAASDAARRRRDDIKEAKKKREAEASTRPKSKTVSAGAKSNGEGEQPSGKKKKKDDYITSRMSSLSKENKKIVRIIIDIIMEQVDAGSINQAVAEAIFEKMKEKFR